MPPTNEPPHRHLRKASPARRKAKPKFEIPVEASAPAASVGWVYRGAETPAPQEPRSVEPSNTNPLVMVGMGLIILSVGAFGMVSLTTLGLVSAPIRIAQGMLRSAGD